MLIEFIKKRAELPVICQINLKLYHNIQKYGVSWEQLDQRVNKMLDDSHFVFLEIGERENNTQNVLLFNIGNDECITKFLC